MLVSTLGYFSVLYRLYSKSLVLNHPIQKWADGIYIYELYLGKYTNSLSFSYSFTFKESPSSCGTAWRIVVFHHTAASPAVERKHDPLEEEIFFGKCYVPSWWFQIGSVWLFLSPRKLGKISNSTHIFQMGWNHQPGSVSILDLGGCRGSLKKSYPTIHGPVNDENHTGSFAKELLWPSFAGWQALILCNFWWVLVAWQTFGNLERFKDFCSWSSVCSFVCQTHCPSELTLPASPVLFPYVILPTYL